MCLAFVSAAHADSYDQKVNESLRGLGKQITDIALVNTEGQHKVFSDLKGATHVIYFFASWCSPCYKSLEDIEQVRIENKLNVNVLGVALDDDKQAISEMLDITGYKGEVWISVKGREPLQNRLFGNAYKALPYAIKIDENIVIQDHSYDMSSKEQWEKVLLENKSFKDATAM